MYMCCVVFILVSVLIIRGTTILTDINVYLDSVLIVEQY